MFGGFGVWIFIDNYFGGFNVLLVFNWCFGVLDSFLFVVVLMFVYGLFFFGNVR